MYFDGAIREIPNGTAQSESVRLPADPPAKPDSLYASLQYQADTRFLDIWLHRSIYPSLARPAFREVDGRHSRPRRAAARQETNVLRCDRYRWGTRRS